MAPGEWVAVVVGGLSVLWGIVGVGVRLGRIEQKLDDLPCKNCTFVSSSGGN